MEMTRRKFLVRSGWLAGGLTVLGLGGCSAVPPLPTFGESSEEDIFTWVQLTPEGTVRFRLPRAEMGQGISTGLSQVVAEELAVGLADIECVHQSTSAMAPCQMTVGSQSIENYMELTARASAYLRETLMERARQRYPGQSIELADAGFLVKGKGFIAYTELLGEGESSVVPLPANPPTTLLVDAQDHTPRVIGREVRPVHIDRIVRGEEPYSRDIRIANMHYGVIARPPQLGAELLEYDREAALASPGVVAVVRQEEHVGVVARTPMAAEQGLAALSAQWQPLSPEPLARVQTSLDIDAYISGNDLDHEGHRAGSLEEGRGRASQSLSLRYDSPMVAHAAMEPRSGVAHWRSDDSGKDICEIWTGSQDPWMVRAAAARALGVSDERVLVYNHRIGGAFGGRVLCQASVEAAWLSQGAGVPVKVQWSREEEFRYNYVGPQFSTRIEAGLDDTGHIAFWDHRAVGAPIITSSMFLPPYLYWAANQVPDSGTQRGLIPPYRFANHRVDFADERVPMPTGPWRGLGAAPNTFAIECAMDELALAAGTDPIEFRLLHLDNERLSACLRRLRTSLGSTQGVGIAATAYKGVTFVAVAAEVAMVDGQLRITRLDCVHDCGRVISPDQVRAQVEGNLVWGIGMALSESFELRDGIARTDNFDNYALPRQLDVPEMNIELIPSDAAPSGAGEAAFAPAAAAIANAVFASTGKRHRQLPVG